MRRPGIATIGSIGLHAAVVALAMIPWPRKDAPVMVSSVPVSIVSSEVAAAAPARAVAGTRRNPPSGPHAKPASEPDPAREDASDSRAAPQPEPPRSGP